MKATYRYLFALLLLSGMIGCDNSTDLDDPIPDETDGRITITNDENVLDDRLIDEDEDIEIDTTALGKRADVMRFRLRNTKTVSSPKISGNRLQATSVSLNQGYAYISYNMVGSQYLGAIDVVQVNTGRNAKLITSAKFSDTDMNSVSYSNNFVFLAEASETIALDPYTAVVERLSTSGSKKLTLAGNLRRGLLSFVATSVMADNNDLYATTGNTGYLYKLDASDLSTLDSVALDDARWVDADASNIVVMQGTPGRITVLDKSSFTVTGTYAYPGATIPESKSTVQIIGGKALIAAGDAGVQLVNLATGTIVGSIPRVILGSLDSSLTVTNAVSASGEYAFISNGEAGVYVAQASQSLDNMSGDTPITFSVLGKIKFKNTQSVNHIAYDGTYLILASGLGGARIVLVTF